MDLVQFNKKFDILCSYRDKISGISFGLSFLDDFEETLSNIKEADDEKILVNFYSFKYKIIKKYPLDIFNENISYFYNQKYVNEKIISYNKLYSLLCYFYDKTYSSYNFKYNADFFTKFNVINKFIQGLRKNPTENPLQFILHKVMNNYNIRYFDVSTVTDEQSYMFIIEFVFSLWDAKILSYEKNENKIIFNEVYSEDLSNLLYCSYEIMTLGDNKIYDSFDLSQDDMEKNLDRLYSLYKNVKDRKKLHLDDLCVSMVLSATVSQICAFTNINNIFMETIQNGQQ